MKKITLIEDNEDNRILVGAILDTRYEINAFESGLDALEDLKVNVPDLVLLDISLPEMDGVQVLSRIRSEANLKHLPVIALTAHAMVGDREKYLAKGFNDYVTKPITDESLLLAAIQRCLGAS